MAPLLNRKLAKIAKKCGICREWHNKILDSGIDKRKLAELYIAGLKFCLKNDFPNNGIIKDKFSDIAHDYGIFVDECIDLANVRRVIALGNVYGQVKNNQCGFTEIFAKHDTDIILHLADNSFTRVDVFDNASVEVFISGKARLWLNNYQTKGIIRINESGSPQVKRVDKQTKTYKI